MFCYPKSGYERIHWRIHVHSDFRLRLPPHRAEPRTEEDHRRLLEGCQRPRRRQGHRRRTARQALEAAAGRRHRPHSQQRLQLLRSDAGHRHPSQRDSAALRTSLLRQPGGHALRHGPRLPGRQGRRDRPADEEVVHHQLPLSGARSRVGRGDQAQLHQAVRRVQRGQGAGHRHQARVHRPVHVPEARPYPGSHRTRARQGPGQRRGRRLRRSARQVQRARRRMGPARRAVPRARQGAGRR